MNSTPYCISHRHLGLVATLFALLTATAVFGAGTMIIGEPRIPADADTIRALEDESGRAVRTRDYATMERIWSERFVVHGPNNMVFPNRAAVFAMFRQSAADLYSSYEKSIECIAFNGDLAIVMGVETVTPLGEHKTAQRRYTNVWRFANGTWLLIARQATMTSSHP